jgi:hypothetical protein
MVLPCILYKIIFKALVCREKGDDVSVERKGDDVWVKRCRRMEMG